jgi:hypothetical protein
MGGFDGVNIAPLNNKRNSAAKDRSQNFFMPWVAWLMGGRRAKKNRRWAGLDVG